MGIYHNRNFFGHKILMVIQVYFHLLYKIEPFCDLIISFWDIVLAMFSILWIIVLLLHVLSLSLDHYQNAAMILTICVKVT